MIYDGNGELIWCGGLLFYSQRSNVEDFRLSNVNGEMLMTMFAQNQVVVLNNDYTIRSGKLLEPQGWQNTHELNLVNDGRQVIVLMNDVRVTFPDDFPDDSRLESEGQCTVRYDRFSVRDVTQPEWPTVFEWQSFGKIGLDESTFYPNSMCTGWDFL